MLIVDKKIYDERIKICRSCEHLQKKLGIETCNLCGCVMTVKARLKWVWCPDNPPRWLDDYQTKEPTFYEEDED